MLKEIVIQKKCLEISSEVSTEVQLTISIVSHGQSALALPLLMQLDSFAEHMPMQVVLTENILTATWPELSLKHLKLIQLRNLQPKGFAENHNAAFEQCQTEYFCVLNPDVRCFENPFPALMQEVQQCPGIVGPMVVNSLGNMEDSARRLPTVARLIKRYLWSSRVQNFDYKLEAFSGKTSLPVDWLAGMCLLFDAVSYRELGGFDERYHLYCEDVDICLRAWRAGKQVHWLRTAKVLHDGQRASHRKLRYLRWHLSSLVKLFMSDTYRGFRGGKKRS